MLLGIHVGRGRNSRGISGTWERQSLGFAKTCSITRSMRSRANRPRTGGEQKKNGHGSLNDKGGLYGNACFLCSIVIMGADC